MKYNLTYEGPARLVGFLAQELLDAGATEADYQPPYETKNLLDVANQVAVSLTVTGTAAVVGEGVRRFRQHYPDVRVLGLPQPDPRTVPERLKEVEKLRLDRDISDDEAAAQRSKILGEI